MESDNFFEEVELLITAGCVREVGDSGWAGPANDGGEEYANENGTTNAIHHQKHSEDSEKRR